MIRPFPLCALLCGLLCAGGLTATERPLDITTFYYVESKYAYRNNKTGPFECNLDITRYYGTKEERMRQVQLGLMPKKVRLCITHCDCDSEDTEDYPSERLNPEVDTVTLNGHELGKLRGLNNHWAVTSFEVPIEHLKFPASPGQIGRNKVVIKVDTANHECWWDLVLGTITVDIPTPRPIFLVHGWTDSLASVQGMASAIRRRFGIPTCIAEVSYANSPAANARLLQRQLEKQTEKYGVSSFQFLAHSKGGLDSRVLMDAAGLGSPMVAHLIQVATPNGGSHLANALEKPKGAGEYILKSGAWIAGGYEGEDNPGRHSLTVESCAAFNRRYGAPRAPIYTIIGYVYNVGYTTGNGQMDRLTQWGQKKAAELSYDHDSDHEEASLPDSRKGDLVVSVASAHCLGTQVAASPLRDDSDLRYSHGEIMVKGADGVLNVFEGLLTGKGVPARPGSRGALRGRTVGASADGVSYMELAGMAEGVSSAVEGWVELTGTSESGATPFTVRGEAPLTVTMTGLPAGASAELVAPDGTRTPLERLDQVAGLEYLEGMAIAEVTAAPRGRYALEVKGVGKGLMAFEVKADADAPPSLALRTSAEPRSEDRLDFLVTAALELDGETVRTPLSAPALARRLDVPQGTECPAVPLELRDDGEGGDERAGDGVYSALVHLGDAGVYEALVALEGEVDGLPDTRSAKVRLAALPSAEISADFAVETPDEDGNGLYDCLRVRLSALAPMPGEYVLRGRLVAEDGTALAESAGTVQVASAGPLAFALSFDGRALSASESEGAWRLADVTLCWVASGKAECAVPVAALETELAVGEFRAADFEQEQPLRLKGCVADWREEPSLCGGYVVDHLCVLTALEAPPLLRGRYTFQARLCDANGRFLCLSEPAEVDLGERDGEDAFPVCFRFEGWNLRRQGVAGPYRLSTIVVTPGAAAAMQENAVSVTLAADYATAAYSPSSFSPKRKSLVLYPQYHGVVIGEPGEADADGWRTVELSFTMPTQEQLVDYFMYALPLYEEFCFWDFGTEVTVCTASADCELENAVAQPLHARTVAGVTFAAGNAVDADGHWGLGETRRFQVRFRMELEAGEAPPLVLALFIDREQYAPAATFSDGICHELDTDQNNVLEPSEVAAGWEAWKQDECMSQVFLEAVTLGKYAEYRFDDATDRFQPAP